MNAAVESATNFGNSFVVTGAFRLAGSATANGIARFDGSSWQPMLGGTFGSVQSLARHGSDLVAAGTFNIIGNTVARRIACRTTSGWQALGAGLGGTSFASVPSVWAVTSYGGEIVAGGDFVEGPIRNIARWNGSAWVPMATTLNGPVYSLAVHQGSLYAGGGFSSNPSQPSGPRAVARWNGSDWQPVGSLNGGVQALAVFDGDLIAGGYFTFGGNGPYVSRLMGGAWQRAQGRGPRRRRE